MRKRGSLGIGAWMIGGLLACAGLATTLTIARPASAFVHIVRRGETLASIAQRVYGRADMEHVLVGANALQTQGGSTIATGMRLDLPALAHVRTTSADSWGSLAERYLGDERFSSVLAEANGTKPWLQVEAGASIVVPYVLRHYAAADETIFDLAQRYLGDKMLAWQLVTFNDLKGNDIRRGDVILVPLKDLSLTPEGEAEAAAAGSIDLGNAGVGGIAARRRQQAIEAALPDLLADVQSGRWLEAIALGNRLLGVGDATRSQLARIGKWLATAYVAVDATGAAFDACQLYLDNANVVHLEPATTSPKLRAVCVRKP